MPKENIPRAIKGRSGAGIRGLSRFVTAHFTAPGLMTMAVITLLTLWQPVASAATCNRGCMTKIADQYLQGLASGKTETIPVASNAVIALNAVAAKLGEGVAPIESIAARQYYIDADKGQMLIYSMLKLRNNPLLNAYGVRLKVVKGRITEIESILREPDAAAGNALVPADVLYDAPVPQERRMSREALITAANRYYTAVASGDAAKAQFSRRCDRFDTGHKFDCAAGVSKVTPAGTRTFMVDIERGLVASFTFIGIALPDRNINLYVAVLTKVDADRIRAVEEISTMVPPDTATPFSE